MPTLRDMVAVRFSRRMAGALLRFGLPRVPQGLMHQGMAISDRFFLGLYLPLGDVGLYMIATSIASLTKLYSVSFNTAWMPFAFDNMERSDAPRLFARMGTYSFAVLVFVAVGVSTLSESLIAIMTPAAYHPATRIVPLLAAGIVVQASGTFLLTALNVAKRTMALPLTTALAAMVTIAGHLVLIPRWGVTGAAVSIVLGQVVLTLSLGIVAHRTYPIPYEWNRLVKLAAVAALWYVMVSTVATGSHWLTLTLRGAALAGFPLGLLGVRFFTPAEWRDLRRALHLIRPGGLERSTPPVL
jgi:O-antigen/teichoic acid export membrane protein